MVKNKKALTLLLVFLAFFNSPAYPKGKSIKYLPSSQDVETVSKDYSSSPIALEEINCPACTALSNSAKECNDCVDLEAGCPDNCLTATSPKVIRCSPDDNTDGVGNYACTSAPFDFEKCSQIIKCGLRSGDNPDTTNCSNLECSGVSVVSTTSPYGRQRRGCPDADSDELAPSGCSSCDVSGTGKDRVWTCPKTSTCTPSSSPSFQTCSETSGPPRSDDLTSYYNVTYVWENDGTDRNPTGCSSCTLDNSCPSRDPAGDCNSSNATSCSNIVDNVSDSCTYSCNCVSVPVTTCTSWTPPPPPWTPPPPPWTPPPPSCSTTYVTTCDTCTCNGYVECTAKVKLASYTYELNDAFKGRIVACTDYADDYEECKDRVECCQEAVGFDDCTAIDDSDGISICEKRSTVSPACYNATTGDCVRLNDAAEQCLEGAADICFKEIGRYDISGVIDIASVARYDFTARTGEAYNVIWQINTEPLNEAKKDDNAKFYTMIKVLDPAGNKVVYRSMLHQKSLNAAFSIYGKALIPKGKGTLTLAPGKNYQIQVHYFMNDDSYTNYKVEIKHMSITVIRVRE